jgi:broad specificity phosphatase PhoE
LVLVRHAAVTVRSDVPSRDWHVSPEGRAAADALASNAIWKTVDVVYASTEPKAIGTAQRIAAPNGHPVRIEHELHEVERPWVGEGAYRATAERYLRGEVIEGWEHYATVQQRVTAEVGRIADGGPAAIVSHGLALTLLLAKVLGIDAEEATAMWSELRFPDAGLLDWPSGPFEGWSLTGD